MTADELDTAMVAAHAQDPSVLTDAEWEALLVAFTDPDDDCAHNVAPLRDAVEALLADRAPRARAEGAAAALREAARIWSNSAGSVLCGAVASTLRARADRFAPTTEGAKAHREWGCMSCMHPLTEPVPEGVDCSVPEDHHTPDPPLRNGWGPCRHGNGFPCRLCMHPTTEDGEVRRDG